MEWITLITTLLGPLLMKCFQGSSNEDPREFLKAHYNPDTDEFSGNIVEDALPQTYRAIRKARRQTPHKERKNFPKYSREEVIQMTKDHLKDSMKASDEKLRACKVEADSLEDEDVDDSQD